jgi:hypothetical protein
MWVDNFKGPLFYVDDASATPLALIKDTKLVGMAVKRHKNWTAVYLSSGTDCLGTKFFGELAKEAGIIPVGPQDEITYFGNDFLVIHAVKPGKKQLNWGYDADLYDITADKIIARRVKTVTVDMKFGETRWFKLK